MNLIDFIIPVLLIIPCAIFAIYLGKMLDRFIKEGEKEIFTVLKKDTGDEWLAWLDSVYTDSVWFKPKYGYGEADNLLIWQFWEKFDKIPRKKYPF